MKTLKIENKQGYLVPENYIVVDVLQDLDEIIVKEKE